MGNCMQTGLACRKVNHLNGDGPGSGSLKPLLDEHQLTGEKGEGKVVRVRVVLTKAEVALILAKGGISRTDQDKGTPVPSILQELASQLERVARSSSEQRQSLQSSSSACGSGWRPALESIAEVC